ncbi:MAG: hypothetical protein LBV67_03330, partial [Streptococcaceae bacterium]|nr:hypothetical protein [Streptococcaceae bacterium]
LGITHANEISNTSTSNLQTSINNQTLLNHPSTRDNSQLIIEKARELGIDTSSKEIIITDSQMYELLKVQGIDVTPPSSLMRIEGVNKVVNKGTGSWDFYLSATTIRNYAFLATGVAAILAVLVPGVSWGVALAIANFAASCIDRYTTNGYIFQVRQLVLVNGFRQ